MDMVEGLEKKKVPIIDSVGKPRPTRTGGINMELKYPNELEITIEKNIPVYSCKQDI